MKVALIYFGQAKTYTEQQHDTFKTFLEPSIQDYEIHNFHVTTKRLSFENPRNGSEGKVECHWDTLQRFIHFHYQWFDGLEDEGSVANQKIRKLTEQLLKLGRPWGEYSEQSLINSLRQIYSLEYFIKRFTKAHEYDLFILLRSDLWFVNPMPDLESLFADADFNDIFVPVNAWANGGCNDRFMMTKSIYTLQTYCTRFSRILCMPEFYHAEQFCLKHLYRNQIHLRRIPNFTQRLLRGNGKLTNFFSKLLDDIPTEKEIAEK